MLDPDAAPMYWREPGMLLDLFGEMAERNLFLVQHLQALPRRWPSAERHLHGLGWGGQFPGQFAAEGSTKLAGRPRQFWRAAER